MLIRDQPLSAFETRWSTGPRTGFAENLLAEGRAQLRVDNANSRYLNMGEAYVPIVQAVEARRQESGIGRPVVNPYGRQKGELPFLGDARRARLSPDALERQLFEEVARIREQDPGFLKDTPDRETVQRRGEQTALEAETAAQNVGGRATTTGAIGGWIGRVGASMADPPNIIAAAFGAPVASSLLRFAVTEALIAGGTQTAIEPFVAKWRREIGLDYTAKDFALNVAGATAGGFLFGGALGAGIKGFGAVGDALRRRIGERAVAQLEAAGAEGPEALTRAVGNLSRRQLIAAFDTIARRPEPDQVAARNILGTNEAVDQVNPLEQTPAGQNEHRQRLQMSIDAVADGAPPPLPAEPATPVRDAPPLPPAQPGLIEAYRPADVEVDASLFQFKGGGDAYGVTERLAGVKEWDPVKAGLTLVYQFEDGRRVIADGHQRLGLARRIKAENPDADVTLYGVTLREADGITPDQARVIAAMKNIAEGTGTPVDAAKVLRVDPARLGELPPRSSLVRTARDLVELSDRAFGLVINGVVPERFAAIVGRLIKNDPALQEAALGALARAEPANVTEAEAMVRQMLSVGGSREVQTSLFGEEQVFQSYMVERARVMSRASRTLKRDRSVFRTLTAETDRIEAAGNRLASDENARRADSDARSLELLQVLANRKGPISDALTNAAKRAREEGRYDHAVADFIAAVRSAADDGDLERLGAGAGGRPDEAADEGRPRPSGGAGDTAVDAPGVEQAQLEPFAEPAGAGQAEQSAFLVDEIQASAGMPSRASSAGEAGGDLASSARVAPPGAQPSGPQVSARQVPSASSTSRETPPSIDVGATTTFEMFEVGAIDRASDRNIRQGSDDFKALLAEAEARRPGFEAALRQLTQDLLGAEAVGVRVKDPQGLAEKIAQGRPAQTIGDYLGGRLAVEDPQALRRLVDRIGQTWRMIETEDFLDAPKMGYRAVHLQVDLGGGMSAELQLVPRRIAEVQHEAHALYDKWKRTDIAAMTEADRVAFLADRAASEAMFDRAWSGSTFARAIDRTDQGAQRVIPGAERISDRQAAERRMARPMRAGAPQRAADVGLFDQGGRDQLDFEVAAARGEDGPAEIRTAQDLAGELDADAEFEAQLGLCNPGGGA